MAHMQAWTKKVISKDDWEKKLAAVKVYKEDMNKLVMDFLVTEVGSPSQAEQCYQRREMHSSVVSWRNKR